MSLAALSAPVPPVQVYVLHEIFAVVDNGRGRAAEYATLRSRISDLAQRYPSGVGCLAVIPADASPPSDEARAALNQALHEASGSLRCMCWLVEGAGFQAAMVQAILTGLRFVNRRTYATHVAVRMPEAVVWVQKHLPDTWISRQPVAQLCQEITRLRAVRA